MAVTINLPVVLASDWTTFKSRLSEKSLLPRMQYEDDGTVYTIFAFDDVIGFQTTIWKGTLPDGIISGGYSQATNDADKTDFENNYKAAANNSLRALTDVRDDRVRRSFGNVTTSATSEVLVSAAAYAEPASQAQRSLVSSNANDASPGGSGARIVRIEYLDSSYNFFTEDVALNGTTPVNTVSTTIRFIQAMYVIAGTQAAGTISLKSTTGGGGTNVCQIASATENAFLCHYYCPAGKRAWVLGWGVTTDDETSMRLKSQSRINNLLVDTNFDLEKMFAGNPTPPNRLTFERTFLGGTEIAAQTYTRVTTQPNQNTSTTTRSWLYILEEP